MTFVCQNQFFKLTLSFKTHCRVHNTARALLTFQIKLLNKDPRPLQIATNFVIKDALTDIWKGSYAESIFIIYNSASPVKEISMLQPPLILLLPPLIKISDGSCLPDMFIFHHLFPRLVCVDSL